MKTLSKPNLTKIKQKFEKMMKNFCKKVEKLSFEEIYINFQKKI